MVRSKVPTNLLSKRDSKAVACIGALPMSIRCLPYATLPATTVGRKPGPKSPLPCVSRHANARLNAVTNASHSFRPLLPPLPFPFSLPTSHWLRLCPHRYRRHPRRSHRSNHLHLCLGVLQPIILGVACPLAVLASPHLLHPTTQNLEPHPASCITFTGN